jgi:protein tyrosine/serine phosphatase
MPYLPYIVLGAALGGVLVGVLVRAYVGRLRGNPRVVDPGQVYRGGQLKGTRLLGFLQARGIRAVLNLLGANPEDAALEEERRTCRERGIVHVDLDLNADELPSPEAVETLLDELDTLPRPLLIHGEAGSEGTGLASALYLHVQAGCPLDRAQASQLTWHCGHWSSRRARGIHRFFDLYRLSSGALPLREWVVEEYPAVYAERRRREEREALFSTRGADGLP